MLIEVEGERFTVGTRVQPNGLRVYDFTWLDGPGETSYGFTLGPTSPSPSDLSRTELEKHAHLFVRAFFAPDGIGPSDFPEFVASRRADRTKDTPPVIE